MQIASDFFLVKFGNIIFKFSTYGSLSKNTFEINARVSNRWHSLGSLIILSAVEGLEKIE